MTDRVGRLVGERQIVDVALPHLRVREAGALELGARVGQHGRAQVDAEAAPDSASREQLEHAARAGAEVDEQIERARRPAPSDTAASTSASATCSARMLSHSPACAWK